MQKNNANEVMVRDVVMRVLGEEASPEELGRAHARTEILIHSINVFARRGLERTTVQHLLDAAGISRRTFYKYFRNKVDVLESIYQILVENMILRFRNEAERSGTLSEVIRHTCNIYFDYHLSLGPIIRLMMEEARRADSVLAPHREKAYAVVSAVMQNELQRVSGRRLDVLVHRSLIWNFENLSLYLLNETDCSTDAVGHCKQVMVGIAEAILAEGPHSQLLAESS